jgi:hypothetical protein
MHRKTLVAGVLAGALTLAANAGSLRAQGASQPAVAQPAVAQPSVAQPAPAQPASGGPGGGENGSPAASPGGERPTPVPLGDIAMISEREVFSYPGFTRRNPFRPLLGDESGPRFEQVELRGILYDNTNSGRSVAIVALRAQAERQIQQIVQRQVAAQESTTAARQDTIYVPEATERLRVGQKWGNMRVARIEEDHVVVSVTEFGITEQRILRIVVRRQGGPS